MAAAGGSTVTSLIMAQHNSIYRELDFIRNRTVSMGVNPDLANKGLPQYNMWFQARGGYSDLNSSGDRSEERRVGKEC